MFSSVRLLRPSAMPAFSCNIEKFYTLPNRVLRCDGFHTTFQRQRVVGTVFSPSDQRAATGGFRVYRDPHDPLC
jgi:hypothetical protein